VEDAGLPAALKAVELSPNDLLSLDALGFAYFSSGRFANAEQTLLQAIELAPEYFPAHIHLAMNHLAQGNRAAAFNELTYVRDADNGGSNGEFAKQLLAQYFP
jgi:Flp pilus assembly protein TadD